MTGNDGLLKLLEVLNQLAIPYMLVGSYSSNYYGIPRSTKDADLVLQVEGDELARLADQLPEGLSFEAQSFFEMVTATRKELLHVEGTNFVIELFQLSSDSFDQARFERRVEAKVDENKTVWFPTAEDVVIQKLRWSKDGGRGKDFDDVVSVLKIQKSLDFDYINRWCGIHESLSLLEKALTEAGGN